MDGRSVVRVLLLSVLMVAFMIASPTATSCLTNSYEPCKCTDSPNGKGPNVNCINAPQADPQRVFVNSKDNYFNQVILSAKTKIIPFHFCICCCAPCPCDTIDKLIIRGSGELLVIPRNAFKNTSISNLKIQTCDLSKIDWSFLAGITNLISFTVSSSTNFQNTFYTFPSASLSSLSTISLSSMIGMNGFSSGNVKLPAILPKGLTSFSLAYCNMDNNAINFILSKWVLPSSKNTLITLNLSGNTITQIPASVSSFAALTNFIANNNVKLSVIQAAAFTFNAPVQTISMEGGNQIASIAAGAFKGDFSDAFVSLYNNKLTTFASGTFFTMLQQMSSSTGYLEVNGNPFNCAMNQCGLAWLIRDYPSLLSSMWSAQCSNGTYFYQLNGNALVGLNGVKCPEIK